MVLRAWGRSDPEAALRQAQQFPRPALRRPYMDAVLAAFPIKLTAVRDYAESLFAAS